MASSTLDSIAQMVDRQRILGSLLAVHNLIVDAAMGIGNEGAYLCVVFVSWRCFDATAYIDTPGRDCLNGALYIVGC